MTEETTIPAIEEPKAQPIEETEAEPKKLAIAPRFTKEELDDIDSIRGERTKTEFVHDAVIVQLDLNHKIAPYLEKAAELKGENQDMNSYIADAIVSYNGLQSWKKTEAQKKAVVLKHDCGEKYDVQRCGDAVFLICKKCHRSEKLSKEAYEARLTEAAKQ
jgi:hypothetical protein